MSTQTGVQAEQQKDWRRLAVQIVVLGVSSLGVGGFTIDHPGNLIARTFLFVVGLAVLLTCVLAPTIIAFRAMRATRRTVHGRGNEPLQITRMVSDALYGSRTLIYLVVGATPFLVFAIFYIVVWINAIFARSMGCAGNYDQERFGCFLWPSPSNAELVKALLSLMALAIAFWGLALLGASLGVGLGLRRWYTTLSTVVVLILLLVVSVGLALLMLQAPPHAQLVKATFPPVTSGPSAKLVYMQGQTPAEDIPAVAPGLLPQSLVIMLIPFAAAAVIMVLSRRYLPKGTT